MIPPFVKPYDKPLIYDLAIVIVYWNVSRCKQILQNLTTIRTAMEAAGLPVFVGEVAFDNAPFEVTGSHVFQWRSSSYMFYKENVFMQVAKALPSEFTKVMLLDSDILFEKPDWYTQVSRLLDRVDVCQPFSYAHWLSPTFSLLSDRESILVDPMGHPGFAWAFRRDWLTAHPLCEYAVSGQGDTVIAYRIGASEGQTLPDLNGLDRSQIQPPPRTAAIPCSVYHLYHGAMRNRQYQDRHYLVNGAMRAFGYSSVIKATERRGDGLLEWAPDVRPGINALMMDYFKSRQDDK